MPQRAAHPGQRRELRCAMGRARPEHAHQVRADSARPRRHHAVSVVSATATPPARRRWMRPRNQLESRKTRALRRVGCHTHLNTAKLTLAAHRQPPSRSPASKNANDDASTTASVTPRQGRPPLRHRPRQRGAGDPPSAPHPADTPAGAARHPPRGPAPPAGIHRTRVARTSNKGDTCTHMPQALADVGGLPSRPWSPSPRPSCRPQRRQHPTSPPARSPRQRDRAISKSLASS